jgi:hypothetical protein
VFGLFGRGEAEVLKLAHLALASAVGKNSCEPLESACLLHAAYHLC